MKRPNPVEAHHPLFNILKLLIKEFNDECTELILCSFEYLNNRRPS